jgi:hypothetical protein
MARKNSGQLDDEIPTAPAGEASLALLTRSAPPSPNPDGDIAVGGVAHGARGATVSDA